VALQDTVPPVLRASDADRENVIGILRDGSADGRLSYDTFLRRVDLALQARGLGELTDLVRDLPQPPRPGTRPRLAWLDDGRRRAGAWLRRAWQETRTPWLPRLALPRGDRPFVIGRSPDCDLSLPNMTVSWRHAEMRRVPAGWELSDLGSTNGTHVNGWAAGAGFLVQPGDWVRFGTAKFRITGG
jgi:hypothetical protein